jgi:PHP family Zn ribbon phosphoesterase
MNHPNTAYIKFKYNKTVKHSRQATEKKNYVNNNLFTKLGKYYEKNHENIGRLLFLFFARNYYNVACQKCWKIIHFRTIFFV